MCTGVVIPMEFQVENICLVSIPFISPSSWAEQNTVYDIRMGK